MIPRFLAKVNRWAVIPLRYRKIRGERYLEKNVKFSFGQVKFEVPRGIQLEMSEAQQRVWSRNLGVTVM